ncbi:hypothetical protein [Amycolatopsis sp. cmx-11-12]|uniref:hypothetical protein n=1 Tax=Amycolatopsis sp. cmx-11-12 TaxID=2785795 RepID=UPI0039185535
MERQIVLILGALESGGGVEVGVGDWVRAEVLQEAVDADLEPDDRPVCVTCEVLEGPADVAGVVADLGELVLQAAQGPIVAGWAESRYHSSGWAWGS